MSEEKSIGSRLREERERLGLSQTDFGERGGVRQNTQYLYETDKRMPGGDYLAAVALLKVDIAYVLTGAKVNQRINVSITPDEMVFIDQFRRCSIDIKRGVKSIVKASARDNPDKEKETSEPFIIDFSDIDDLPPDSRPTKGKK